jgi:hypothetical protein
MARAVDTKPGSVGVSRVLRSFQPMTATGAFQASWSTVIEAPP